MICTDFREIADSYLSDELLTETNHDMIRHMESCEQCRDLIGARREIRSRLRTAVVNAPEYQLNKDFDHLVMTRIRLESDERQSRKWFSWFGIRTFAASAAGLLVVVVLGFILVSNLSTSSGSSAYLVPGFSEQNLLNIASGDHQHCAVKYALDERPLSIAEGDPSFVGLDSVVSDKVSAALKDHRLLEAHACKYKDVRFAHFVMESPGDRMSVLVAPANSNYEAVGDRIADFASEQYRVASFKVDKNAVFVISTLDRTSNRKAAESLVEPFRRYLRDRNGVQTAMLANFGSNFLRADSGIPFHP